jgi:hypothetical protein
LPLLLPPLFAALLPSAMSAEQLLLLKGLPLMERCSWPTQVLPNRRCRELQQAIKVHRHMSAQHAAFLMVACNFSQVPLSRF